MRIISKAAAVLSCVVVFLLPQACKDKVVDRDPTALDSLQDQTTPEAVLNNFKLVYNFTQNGIEVEKAIELYRDYFSNDTNGPQYEFKYLSITGGVVGTNPSFMPYADEMSATAALFREVARNNLKLDLKEFRKVISWVEVAEDTATQEKKHPGEDWYVYQMNAYMTMDNPNPADLPYLVKGEGVFSVRRCNDDMFRIIRWVDNTGANVLANPKNTAVNQIYSGTAWGYIKALYR
jgi:hypothetical protein